MNTQPKLKADESNHLNCLSEGVLNDYVDQNLSSAERIQIVVHLDSCESCKSMVGDFQEIVSLAAELKPAPVPSDVSRRLRQRLAQDLDSKLFANKNN